MSSHYETKKPLSAELIEKIVKRSVPSLIYTAASNAFCCDTFSRYVNVGLFYLRQLFFAKFDIKVHTSQSTKCIQLYLTSSDEASICS
jgi:metallopeptidase MepB